MQTLEVRINHQAALLETADRLATTKQLLRYLTNGLPDTAEENFWIVGMNPDRRPINRTRLNTGAIVAIRVQVREVFLSLLLAEAGSFACLRTQPVGPVRPNLADCRLGWNLRETGRLMNIEFADYFIARHDGREYHSWRENERRSC
jgi:DNA repair protein RadC